MISCGDRNTAAVTVLGDLWTWGAGDAGRLGHGDEFYRYFLFLELDIMAAQFRRIRDMLERVP